jgi:hypothetical protein
MNVGDDAFIEVRADGDGLFGIQRVRIASIEVHPAEGTFPPGDWRSTSGRFRLFRFEEPGTATLPEAMVFPTVEQAEAVSRARCVHHGWTYIGLI